MQLKFACLNITLSRKKFCNVFQIHTILTLYVLDDAKHKPVISLQLWRSTAFWKLE